MTCKQKQPKGSCLRNNLQSGSLDTLEKIVDCFQVNHPYDMSFYSSQNDITEAIRVAALCKIEDDKRHPHQHLIPQAVLEKAHKAIMERLDEIIKVKTFEILYGLIRGTIKQIHGIGDLTVYDISHRIGAFKRLEPEKVYLHRGTLDGAKELKKRNLINSLQSPLEKNMFPSAFQVLTPAQIEDCLCCCKDHLKKLMYPKTGE